MSRFNNRGPQWPVAVRNAEFLLRTVAVKFESPGSVAEQGVSAYEWPNQGNKAVEVRWIDTSIPNQSVSVLRFGSQRASLILSPSSDKR